MTQKEYKETDTLYLQEASGVVQTLINGKNGESYEWEHPVYGSIHAKVGEDGTWITDLFGASNLHKHTTSDGVSEMTLEIARLHYDAKIMELVDGIIESTPVGSFWRSNQKQVSWTSRVEGYSAPVVLMRFGEDFLAHGSLVCTEISAFDPSAWHTIPSMCDDQKDMWGEHNETVDEVKQFLWEKLYEFIENDGDPYFTPVPALEEVL